WVTSQVCLEPSILSPAITVLAIRSVPSATTLGTADNNRPRHANSAVRSDRQAVQQPLRVLHEMAASSCVSAEGVLRLNISICELLHDSSARVSKMNGAQKTQIINCVKVFVCTSCTGPTVSSR